MVSTRFSGLDGVSLEAAKVAEALRPEGFEFVWFGGLLGDGFVPGRTADAARFDSEENRALEAACFAGGDPSLDVRSAVASRAVDLKDELVRFVEEFSVDCLLVQNALAIPMQLPLGVALAEMIAETKIPAVAHHHDFSWERRRFDACAVPDILDRVFPPRAPNLAHVVINRDARDQLMQRHEIEATVLPNVMDFSAGGGGGDGGAYRRAADLTSDDIVLLQPTRVIERKGIESTLQLAGQLAEPRVKIVVSHGDDLDEAYWNRLVRMSEDLGVDMRLVAARSNGFGLADAYAAADLVCFPSLYEGFGNALLEAFFYRKPVLVNRYPVYARDIAPTGVRCVEIDGEVTASTVEQVRCLLEGVGGINEITAHNFEVGKAHFSYDVVRARMGPLLRT